MDLYYVDRVGDGGFHKWGYPKIDADFMESPKISWMISGYHLFRIPPYPMTGPYGRLMRQHDWGFC